MTMLIDNTKYLDEGFLKEKQETYKKVLLSSGVTGIENLLAYLENKTDFFTAPASTKYHGNYEGALVVHSLNVLQCLMKMNQTFKLNLSQSDMTIAALLHDVCKCNLYEKAEKFFKPDGRTWVAYMGYNYSDNLPLGHGEKSVMIIQRFIKLKAEVALMIRWHMGGFDASDDKTLRRAMELSKAVTALHLSDMQASNFLEPTVDLQKIPETSEFLRFRTGVKKEVETLDEF